MELGALICTARSPALRVVPARRRMRHGVRLAGPEAGATTRRAQPYDGTDRQARGRLLAVLRERCASAGRGTVPTWTRSGRTQVQRARALDWLVADGLVEPLPDGRYRLPRQHPPTSGS